MVGGRDEGRKVLRRLRGRSKWEKDRTADRNILSFKLLALFSTIYEMRISLDSLQPFRVVYGLKEVDEKFHAVFSR